MPTDSNRLRRCVEALRSQLDELPAADAAAVDRLRTTLAEIEAAMDSSNRSAAGAGLGRRLATAARGFEDSHPALSGAVGSVIDALGRMGI